MSEFFYTYLCFLFLNQLVLLSFVQSIKSLPRQSASKEVHKHQPYLLQIVSPCLLDSEMRVETCVTSCTCKFFAVTVLNVSASPRVFESLGQTEVDYVNQMLLTS